MSQPLAGDSASGNEPPHVPDHQLLKRIGCGAYGEVWLARNVMGSHRAVKVVRRSGFEDDRPYEREFSGISRFEPVSRSHEGFMDILQVGRDDSAGCLYYVMELADDKTTGQEIHPETYSPKTLLSERQKRGRLPAHDCVQIGYSLAETVEHLHKAGLVHRDIKPANIIFVNGIPKLADIGVVARASESKSLVGTVGYMPPEGHGTPQADIYSLGKVLYEVSTGKEASEFPHPITERDAGADLEQLQEINEVILRACESDPRKRYSSATEMREELGLLRNGKSVKRLRHLVRRLKWALAAAAITLIAGAGAWLVQWHETRSVERMGMMSQAEKLRLGERWSEWWNHDVIVPGWSSNAQALLARAGKAGVDNDLRAQAAATLDGLDARFRRGFPTKGANHVAFDAQGRVVLMDTSMARRARLWDLRTDNITYLSSTKTGPVWFAKDGSPRQFVCEGQGRFSLLNLTTGERLREFRIAELETQDPLESPILAVSPDASLCAAAFVSRGSPTKGQLVVWETATGNVLQQAAEVCTALAFSPENECLATGDRDGCVRVHTLPYLNEVVAQFQQDRAEILCLAFHKDVSVSEHSEPSPRCHWLLADGDAGGSICIWQVAERRLKAFCLGSHVGVYAVAFGPDNMTIASADYNHATLWDIATGHELLAIRSGYYGKALAYSPDGSALAIGNQYLFDTRGFVRVFEVEASRGVRALRGFSSQCSHVTFSSDGQRLAALAYNWEVGVWNLASNRLEHLFQAPRGKYADNAALAFSRDDRQLAFATWQRALVWDLESGTNASSWTLPPGLMQRLCFDAAGRLLLFQWYRAGQDADCVWCVRDLFSSDHLKPLAQFPQMRGEITDAVLSRQGNFVVLVAQAKNETNPVVKAFDPVTGHELDDLTDGGSCDPDSLRRNPQTASLDPRLPTTSDSALVKMLEGTPRCRVRQRWITALSPDRRVFAAGTSLEKGVTLFWANNPGRRLRVGIGHSFAESPQFSPDGKLLAVGTTEGTVLVYDLDRICSSLDKLSLGW